ncbi:hypothetical protein GUITHDRAFT_62642, partial [Guillardia theta CCMP2712]
MCQDRLVADHDVSAMASKREKEKGNECFRCGEINAAIGFYSKSLELCPDDHLVLGNRAQAYIASNCFYQAELDCDKALSIEPSYHKARYRRAVALEKQGKYEAAMDDIRALLEQEPENQAAKVLMRDCEYRLKDKRER